MKRFIDILKHLRPYKSRIALNLLWNLLNSAFSVVSFSAIIPFLKILFDQVDPNVEHQRDEFDNNFLNNLNNWFDDYIIEHGPREALFVFCIAVVVLFLVRNLFRYLAQHQMAYLRNVVVRDLREQVYAKLLRLPMAYYTEERKGNIYTRFTSDVAEIEWSVMGALEALFRQPVMILLFFFSLLAISWQLTVFVVIVLPISGFAIGKISKSLKRTAKKSQEELGQVVSALEETVGGIRIVKGFTAEQSFAQRFKKMNDRHFRLMVKMYRRQYLASPVSETLSTFTVAMILWFGGNLVLEGKMLNGEMFILYIAVFSQMLSPARALTEAFARVQRGIVASDRINEILDSDERILEVPNALSIQSFSNSIEFKDMGFKYADQWILRGINLRVSRGDSIALVGPSGGGKSTLVDLLPRFYDILEGELLLDGQPIRNYKVLELRKLFGIVSQHSILFNDTVRNNLLVGNPEATDQQIIDALHVANAHGFVMSMTDGLDTMVGELGNKLSGGQKQRLSIARAVLKNPPILILDEATSALDTESERLVQDALAKLMKGRTSFVIAHRLSTVQHVDRIVVIDKGHIVQMGTHSDLVSQEGMYQRLVQLQELAG